MWYNYITEKKGDFVNEKEKKFNVFFNFIYFILIFLHYAVNDIKFKTDKN